MENIKEKIQKLLNLATSDNEHEAAAALKKATDLMNKWNLDIKTVTGQKVEVQKVEQTFHSWTTELKQLASALCEIADIECVFSNGSKKYGYVATIYLSGRPRDIDNFIYLFSFLTIKIKKESQKYKLSIRESGSGKRNNIATKSFRLGFIQKIFEKLRGSKKEFFTSHQGLVPIDSEVKKKEAAQNMMDYFKDETLSTPKQKEILVTVGHMNAGKDVAEKVDLNVAVNNKGKKQERISR